MRSLCPVIGLLLMACAHSVEPTRSTTKAPPMRFEVRRVEGTTAVHIQTLLDPAREAVRRCVDGGGGKLEIQLTNRRSGLEISVEPGPSLEPTARACVLAALSSIHLEQTGSLAGGPSPAPSSFTSLVTVSW